jgi:DNA-binding transcriptional ArsR family regulator
VARWVEVLKALAHPVRLRVIEALCRGEEHVTALAARLELPQPIVSQQLGILRAAGLVSASGRHGYRVEQPRLRDLLRCMACQRPR